MYSAKFDREEKTEQGTRQWVTFSDGQDVITEWCIPQSEEDFKTWIESRKQSLNTAKALKSKLVVGEVIAKEEKAEVEISTEEKERADWFFKVNRLYRIKVNLIDTGAVPEDDEQYLELVADVQKTRKPEYLSLT